MAQRMHSAQFAIASGLPQFSMSRFLGVSPLYSGSAEATDHFGHFIKHRSHIFRSVFRLLHLCHLPGRDGNKTDTQIYYRKEMSCRQS